MRSLTLLILFASLKAALAIACGGGGGYYWNVNTPSFDPDQDPDAFFDVSETMQAVAQTFPVTWEDCILDEISLVVTQGPSQDTGVLRIDVRPTDDTGAPNPSSSSILSSREIDTAKLPAPLVDEFTTFNFDRKNDGPDVKKDRLYAVVVEFVSRSGSTDSLPIATVLGASGEIEDPYPEGEAFVGASDIAFSATLDDLFFEARLLCG
jgi:hypothetical protein